MHTQHERSILRTSGRPEITSAAVAASVLTFNRSAALKELADVSQERPSCVLRTACASRGLEPGSSLERRQRISGVDTSLSTHREQHLGHDGVTPRRSRGDVGSARGSGLHFTIAFEAGPQ